MRRAKSLVAIGEIELMSTRILPFERPLATPSCENSTCSTSGVSETMVKTISDFSATSRHELQTTAPLSMRSCGSFLRPQRNSRWPAPCRWPAMGRPMMPRPMKPRLDMELPIVSARRDFLLGQTGRQVESVRGNGGTLDLLHGILRGRMTTGIHRCVERKTLEADGFVHLVPVHVVVMR